MKNIVLVVLVALPFLFASCNNKAEQEETLTMVTSTEELEVPQDFNWKTTRDMELTIKGQSDGMLEIVSSKGTTYWKVFVTANQRSTFNFSIPSYETALQLKYNGQTADLKVTSNKLNYEFE